MASAAVQAAAARRVAIGASAVNTAAQGTTAAPKQPSQTVKDAAAARVASGASTKNTVTGQPASPPKGNQGSGNTVTVDIKTPPKLSETIAPSDGSPGSAGAVQGNKSSGVNVGEMSIDGTGNTAPSPTFNQNPNAPGQPEQPQEKFHDSEELADIEPPSDLTSYGVDPKQFEEYLAQYEEMTGTDVNIDHPHFKGLMKEHPKDQASWKNIFNRFALPKDSGKKILTDAPPSTGYVPIKAPPQNTEDPYHNQDQESMTGDQNVTDALADDTSTFEEDLNNLLNSTDDLSGADLLKLTLKLKLDMINDPGAISYLDTMADRAKSAYDDGLAMAAKSESEINKAIEGTLGTPETSEGLMTKIFKQGEELSEAKLDEAKAYEEGGYNITIQNLREKRADLEGYTKAKLYSMGAQDSSAGISLVSKVLNEADMTIELAELDHTHAIRQLNLQGQELVMDYTNNVAKIAMNVKAEKGALLETYNTNLTKIDDERFKTETEKRKSKIQALGEFVKDTQAYQENQDKKVREAMKDAYDRAKQLKDDAYKLSGLTGMVYVPGENGEMVNTGIPTFAANKFISTEQRMANSEARQQANVLLDTYGSGASPYVEQLLGLPEGSLKGLKTVAEKKKAISTLGTSSAVTTWGNDNKSADENDKKFQNYLQKFEPGSVRQNGIGIDPLTIPDVRDVISKMSRITQTFHKPGTGGAWADGSHDGIDAVFKDGYAHAVRAGTVVQTIPWDGKNPYGNRVIVQDDQGLLWQYGHMGSKKGGNPFTVNVGDRVGAEDQLGIQGSTGKSTGPHVHINIVGGMPQETWEPYGAIARGAGEIMENMTEYAQEKNEASRPQDTNQFKRMYFDYFGKSPTKAQITDYNTYGPHAWDVMMKLEEKKKAKTTTKKTTPSTPVSSGQTFSVNDVADGD